MYFKADAVPVVRSIRMKRRSREIETSERWDLAAHLIQTGVQQQRKTERAMEIETLERQHLVQQNEKRKGKTERAMDIETVERRDLAAHLIQQHEQR